MNSTYLKKCANFLLAVRDARLRGEKKCTNELDIRSSERKVSLEVFLKQNIMEAHHGYIKNASPDFLSADPGWPQHPASRDLPQPCNMGRPGAEGRQEAEGRQTSGKSPDNMATDFCLAKDGEPVMTHSEGDLTQFMRGHYREWTKNECQK